LQVPNLEVTAIVLSLHAEARRPVPDGSVLGAPGRCYGAGNGVTIGGDEPPTLSASHPQRTRRHGFPGLLWDEPGPPPKRAFCDFRRPIPTARKRLRFEVRFDARL